MAFWNKICGFITIFFTIAVSAPAQTPVYTTLQGQFQPKKLSVSPLFKLPASHDTAIIVSPPQWFQVIPQDFYTQHFGIMYKKELAIEKATKIPLRFRLGSLQQCNYLEGKK